MFLSSRAGVFPASVRVRRRQNDRNPMMPVCRRELRRICGACPHSGLDRLDERGGWCAKRGRAVDGNTCANACEHWQRKEHRSGGSGT